MAFIINKRGERVHVDIEVDWFSQNCPLYADDAELREHYILNLYKGRNQTSDNAPELVAQVELYTAPSKDDIMYEMWKHGLGRYDIATVEKGYLLDWANTEG